MSVSVASEKAAWLDGMVSRREAVGSETDRAWRQAALRFAQVNPWEPARVWVLKAERAGDASQVLALAEALGLPFEVKELARRRLDVVFAPPFVASPKGLRRTALEALSPPWPDLVLSSGRENEPVARWIKHRSGGHTRIVHVGRPWGRISAYDLVVTTPQYRLPARENVLQNEAPLHRITEDRLAAAALAWAPRLAHLPGPHIAVLLGGNSGPYALGREAGERLGRQASALAKHLGGSLVITTSARTPASAIAGLASAIDVPHYLFGWKKGSKENPYFAFLGLADEIVVTADSMSMITEAVATGKPVHLFDLGEGAGSMRSPLGLRGEAAAPAFDPRRLLSEFGLRTAFYRFLLRHAPARVTRDIRRVHERFVASGRASWLDLPETESVRPPLADLGRAVERVRRLLGLATQPTLNRAA